MLTMMSLSRIANQDSREMDKAMAVLILKISKHPNKTNQIPKEQGPKAMTTKPTWSNLVKAMTPNKANLENSPLASLKQSPMPMPKEASIHLSQPTPNTSSSPRGRLYRRNGSSQIELTQCIRPLMRGRRGISRSTKAITSTLRSDLTG